MAKVLTVDVGRCTGCESCMLACSFEAEGSFSLAGSRISIERFAEDGINVPLFCQQCANAPCVAACPSRALRRDAGLAVVTVDEERCIGCRMCSQVCPFGVISYDRVRGIARKCELCGGDPGCVKMCVPGALSFTDAEIARSKRVFAAALKQAGAEKLAEGR